LIGSVEFGQRAGIVSGCGHWTSSSSDWLMRCVRWRFDAPFEAVGEQPGRMPKNVGVEIPNVGLSEATRNTSADYTRRQGLDGRGTAHRTRG
jgi:hypothetical protein